jgi:hypothetical protein
MKVVYTSLAYREPGQVNRASSILYSAGVVSILTGVVHSLPRAFPPHLIRKRKQN